MDMIRQAIRTGFRAVQTARGREAVSFRGVRFDAVIDFTGGEHTWRRNAPANSPRVGIVVEVLASKFPKDAKAGEYVTGSDARTHRIAEVSWRGEFVRLICQPSTP